MGISKVNDESNGTRFLSRVEAQASLLKEYESGPTASLGTGQNWLGLEQNVVRAEGLEPSWAV
jgi:hypothetical protein